MISMELPHLLHRIVYGGLSIFNVYKPPGEEWENPALPHAAHPCIYAGDFNSHSPLWGYRTENRDGESLIRWAEVNDCHLEYDAKQGSTFHSARWGTSTTPDLCFVSCNREGRPLHVTRSVESRFPRSQHSMVVLEIGMRLPCVQNPELPRWNLRKAVWAKFTEEVEKTVSRIPINIPNYGRFSRLLFMAAKRSIQEAIERIMSHVGMQNVMVYWLNIKFHQLMSLPIA
ncbi:uncharacterized protein LOC120354112 [Nilaparvata lugens]|uniref:uncharacterized protein LOC120354112 n=1 Tax=Nilaparvata lugens TaxID=108931 RepID=UPI00193EA0BB|nr:uncharacterized protein LOC120354112 [Nilaparvata lugens]